MGVRVIITSERYHIARFIFPPRDFDSLQNRVLTYEEFRTMLFS